MEEDNCACGSAPNAQLFNIHMHKWKPISINEMDWKSLQYLCIHSRKGILSYSSSWNQMQRYIRVHLTSQWLKVQRWINLLNPKVSLVTTRKEYFITINDSCFLNLANKFLIKSTLIPSNIMLQRTYQKKATDLERTSCLSLNVNIILKHSIQPLRLPLYRVYDLENTSFRRNLPSALG